MFASYIINWREIWSNLCVSWLARRGEHLNCSTKKGSITIIVATRSSATTGDENHALWSYLGARQSFEREKRNHQYSTIGSEWSLTHFRHDLQHTVLNPMQIRLGRRYPTKSNNQGAFVVSRRTPVMRPMVLGPALKKPDPSPPSPPILKASIETRAMRAKATMISWFILMKMWSWMKKIWIE